MEFLNGLQGREDTRTREGRRQDDFNNGPSGIAGIDDLYILGDFFDFWFSAGAFVYPEFRDVVDMLADLKERGIRIHICEGNHDFFLAGYFARHLGMEVIGEWATLNLEGHRVLISHGDTVDGKNRRYLLLRSVLRSNFFYKLQRALPLPFLWRIARISSRLSKEMTAESSEALAKKMRTFAQRKFKDGFDAVILGHCHKHLLEETRVNGTKKMLALLGDWVHHYSYLCYEDGNFFLANFRPMERRF